MQCFCAEGILHSSVISYISGMRVAYLARGIAWRPATLEHNITPNIRKTCTLRRIENADKWQWKGDKYIFSNICNVYQMYQINVGTVQAVGVKENSIPYLIEHQDIKIYGE